MSIDDFRHASGGSRIPLDDRAVDASAAEGRRLVVAFKKIKRQADRLTVIDLVEWLGN